MPNFAPFSKLNPLLALEMVVTFLPSPLGALRLEKVTISLFSGPVGFGPRLGDPTWVKPFGHHPSRLYRRGFAPSIGTFGAYAQFRTFFAQNRIFSPKIPPFFCPKLALGLVRLGSVKQGPVGPLCRTPRAKSGPVGFGPEGPNQTGPEPRQTCGDHLYT